MSLLKQFKYNSSNYTLYYSGRQLFHQCSGTIGIRAAKQGLATAHPVRICLSINCTYYLSAHLLNEFYKENRIKHFLQVCFSETWIIIYKVTKMQISKGIRQLSINWCISLKMIHKITLSVDYNWWLKRLNTKLN